MAEVRPTYLYIKQHSITGMKYFGKTIRMNVYKYDGSGSYWKNHIKKHGRKFVKTLFVLGPYTNQEELTNLALWMSNELDIVNSKEWANLILEDGLSTGGWNRGKKSKYPSSNKGKKSSDETKLKISESLMGNSRRKGKSTSDECKEKLRIANKGKNHTDETKLKMSNSAKGKKRTYEHQKKLNDANRLSMKGKIPSIETRNKRSIAMKGRSPSNKGKKKIVDIITGRKFYISTLSGSQTLSP